MATATHDAQPPSDPGDDRAGAMALLGRTVDGEPLPRLRRRFTPPHFRSDAAWGWIAPLLVTVFVGIFQFWGVTTPHKITFDETYYAKDSYSLLTQHYAREFVNDPDTKKVNEADEIVNSGETLGIFAEGPSLVVHPDVGKWMIAGGEWMFGLTPLGWRFSAALVGTLMILVMCRLVRRLTGSTMLGCVAGLLLGFDGLHFVMSRLALLDIFLAFWLLCAAHCLVADRDWARLKLARRFETSPTQKRTGFGPVRGFLLRPWRLTAGLCLGLACGSKWSGVFVLAGFGLLTWAWDCGMRRGVGVRWPVLKSLAVDAVPAFFSLVGVALLVYVVSWMGLLTHAQKFEDAFGHAVDSNDWTWSSVNDFGGHPDGPIEGAIHDLDILWNYNVEVYDFHTGEYIKEATHPFESNPGGWLLINRPLGVDVVSGGNVPPKDCKGDECVTVPDCPDGKSCVKQILAIGTPALWWGGVLALIVGLGYWLSRRDWRFGLPMIGVLAGWLPWFRYDERPIFYYYAITIIPFTVIATTLVLGKILGRADASPRRRMVGVVACGAFVFLVAANFAYFYPILTDGLLTNGQWQNRMWLTHWI
ncbi:MAG: dolichyl-phosphate-mannose--protein mannosyltransferase [Nocardioidaceae bacterium]